jgi:hypothetical protein
MSKLYIEFARVAVVNGIDRECPYKGKKKMAS